MKKISLLEGKPNLGPWGSFCLLLVAGVLGGRLRAGAAEVDFRLTTIGEGYQTRTAGGELLDRRRVTQWVDLWADRLLDIKNLSCELSFRFDTELGFEDAGDAADLMLFWFRWRPLGNRADFALGRQLFLDELDFLLFDGLRLEIQLPADLRWRLVGGFEVRDRSFLGGEVLELDGVEPGTVPAPVVGMSLLLARKDLWASLDYRRVVLWEDGWPLDEERAGGSFSASFLDGRLGLESGAVFNLLQDRWDRLRADFWARLRFRARELRLEGGYLRSRPWFALDSIFNFFSPAPFDEFHAGVRWRNEGWYSIRLAYTQRRYRPPGQGEPAGDFAGWKVDGLDLDGRLALGRAGWFSLAAGFEDGAVGTRWMVAPRVFFEVVEGRLNLEGRGVVSSFADPLQHNQHAVTVGCSTALDWRFGEHQALVLTAELNSNRILPMWFRLLGVLDLAFHFGPGRYF